MTDARNVYTLKHHFQPDLKTYTFVRLEIIGRSRSFLQRNEGKRVTYSEMETAYKLIDKMREENETPDAITYTTITGGLGLIGQHDKAREVLKEIIEYGCYPDVPAYNAAIRNYCIARRLGDADMLVDEMVRKGLSPNSTTYNLFFRFLSLDHDLGRSSCMKE